MLRLNGLRLAFAFSPLLLLKKGKTAAASKVKAKAKAKVKANDSSDSATTTTTTATATAATVANVAVPTMTEADASATRNATIPTSVIVESAPSTPTPPATVPPNAAERTRHVGTVVSFMHRRGYGFLRATTPTPMAAAATAAATAAASALTGGVTSEDARSFFFPRSSLDGGFYLTAGQSVAFDVRPLGPSRRLPDTLAAAEDDHSARVFAIAHRIRLLDGQTERAVRPAMLYGAVEHWDALAGTGVVAELDLAGALHEAAPRFALALEDLDLGAREEMRRGRYVRFCLEAGDRTAARRVIVDRAAESKRAEKNGRAALAETGRRHTGVVREVVEGRFGFVLLDDSGESIFFHLSNAAEELKAGDTVSFLLREVTMGKHAGKRTCLQVRKSNARPAKDNATTTAAAAVGGAHRQGDDDEEDFDFLD